MLIVSEGEVAQGVREQMSAEGFSNFDLMPFQPMSQYPQVMGTGDVAILEESTGQFSVPSKVLSYLCAQRPILMAAPADNPTSRMVTEAEAGLVVGPRDKSAFLQAARTLKSDDDLRAELASNGRELAERAFNPSAIADRFERLIAQISAGQA
ncbi:MAG: hypothetical protein GWN58_02455 [Anaerolineae bacterium]|nr:hypothetical protein [Anaerolineae bacterium]